MRGKAWTVQDHLRGKPLAIVELYERFVELIEACGPFEYVIGKTAITFKGKRRLFAGAKPTNRSLDGFLDLPRRVKDQRIRRAAPHTKRVFVHQFRISASDQLDREFAGWVREAYDVGQGTHLRPPAGS